MGSANKEFCSVLPLFRVSVIWFYRGSAKGRKRGTVKLFLGDLVVGFEDEDGGFGFHPDVGFLEELGGDVLDRFADGFRRMEPAFFGDVEIVGGAEDAVLSGGDALGLGDLQNPADEIVFGEAAFGIADENDELLFDGGRFFVVTGLGLHGEVHFLDDGAEDFGVELVLFQNLGDGADFDFRHDDKKGVRARTAHERGGK